MKEETQVNPSRKEMTPETYKIILFLCSWGPHAAYQKLQDTGYRIPSEIKMVSIPCTGRISKAILCKAFEMGADGVAIVGCVSGACRYGNGTITAEKNTADTQGLLNLLGLGGERMRLGTFLPDETESLAQFLSDFAQSIRAIGKSPVQPAPVESVPDQKEALSNILARHDAYSCQDCGKCTASCPLALSGKAYSPRAIVNTLIRDSAIGQETAKDIYACLTCGLCYERCPSNVNFPEFIRDMRGLLNDPAGPGNDRKPHGGFFQSLMRTMAAPGLRPARWGFLPPEIRIDPQSPILFFGGCAPYFDAFFRRHQNIDSRRILVDALKLLNFFDVSPRLLDSERCCGHDLLWSGDRENFLRLARLNVENIEEAGVTTVITACPECYQTLAKEYEKQGITPSFTVIHLYEFLEKEIDKGAVTFNPLKRRITYQDACRMNRMETVRGLPRKLIERLSTESFREMKDSGPSALCCGNCAWTGCDAYSKALQVKRIREAHETGSDLMVTSCPKCQIHLRCAMEDPFLGEELKMEMKDLASLIAESICYD